MVPQSAAQLLSTVVRTQIEKIVGITKVWVVAQRIVGLELYRGKWTV